MSAEPALLEVGGAATAPAEAADLVWARSGAMALTGAADGPPRLAPGPLALRARAAVETLRGLARKSSVFDPGRLDVDGAALLAERAAVLGLQRQGRVAPGGSCRLLRAADGWLALNLARDDDRGLLPAWLQTEARPGADAFGFVQSRLRRNPRDALVARGRLVGLAVAPALAPTSRPPDWRSVAQLGPRRVGPARRAPFVLDLSSLWAGPLCTHLLSLVGARVIKVESTRRPDGARGGAAELFDLWNGGKESVALDFSRSEDRLQLARLVASADMVVESARPRALRQLGLRAEEVVARSPGLVWVSITGYGRAEPGGHWVAFGDDAAVAAGLAVATGSAREPIFCGDAIADPLTGVHAAVAALAAWCDGGGRLVELALRDVTANALAPVPAPERGPRARVERAAGGGWQVRLADETALVCAPRARAVSVRARTLGADTNAVLAELGATC